MNGDAPVSFASVHELRGWLASREIPVHLWGTGRAKRVADLWSELSTGESVLYDLPPRRQVAFVSVIVRRGGASLAEVAQLLATGETRTRRLPPGEKMLPGEDAETAARREAYEELGVALESLELIGRFWSSPGVSTERHSLFIAPYSAAARTGEGGGVADEHEGITVVERQLTELAMDVDQGRIADGKLVTLILALRLRRPELFVGSKVA